MGDLALEKKLEYALKMIKKHTISSYKIAQNIPKTDLAIRNIIEGVTKKPRPETIRQLYEYIVTLYPNPDEPNPIINLDDLVDTLILHHSDLINNDKYKDFLRSECSKISTLNYKDLEERLNNQDEKIAKLREIQRTLHEKTFKLEEKLSKINKDSNSNVG